MAETTPTSEEELNQKEEEAEEKIYPKLHISIHSLIESSQSQHGLRHTDYTQYRSYCTRRLTRLRHAKPFRLEVSKIPVIKEKADKKTARHAFKPAAYYRDASLLHQIAKTHENFMLVELYSAERSWCYAMELKAEYDNHPSSTENDGTVKGKSRGHFMSRLKKAVLFANRLQEMADAAADELTIIEARGYAAWMRGNWCLEKGEYESACFEYATALAICRHLAQGYVGNDAEEEKTEKEQLEMRDYFTARAENIIEPMLRFCQYELKDGGMSELDIMDLMKNIPFDSPNMDNNAANTSSPSSIEFRHQTIPISNHSLIVAMLKLETLVSSYNKQKLILTKEQQSGKDMLKQKSKQYENAFLDLLSGYDDANTIVTKEYKEMEGMKSGPAVDSKKQELQSISGYLTYEKTKLLMERNENMVTELRSQSKLGGAHESKLDEIVHLYNALLQDARTVASLPGGHFVVDSEGIAVPVEDDFLLEANANILRFRALRCYYLGKMYSEHQQKYKEAIALFDHAVELANHASEEFNACDSADDDDKSKELLALMDSMIELEKEISGAKCRSEAYAYLSRIGKTPSSSSMGKRSLLNRLDDFDGGSDSGGSEKYHLATVPPALQYIPCKPVFFDIALNHMGDLPATEMQEILEEHTPKSTGLLGWFRRG